MCLISMASALLLGGLPEISLASHPADGNVPAAPSDTAVVPPNVSQADDGWPDLSYFMDQPYGFLPMIEPITEPAIGYGLWAGPAFISKAPGEPRAGWAMPNLSYVGGMWTENDCWGAMAFDIHNWMDQRLQSAVALMYASIKLNFHGIGEDALLKDNPIRYTLTPFLGVVRVKYRLGDSNFWVGGGYLYSTTKVEIDIPDQFTQLKDLRKDSDIGALFPILTFDSRENIFTPTSGTAAELTAAFCSKALGGDAEFQRASVTATQYFSLDPALTLGLRGDGLFSFGDVPFYAYPYVTLRGAAAMRYQGEQVAQGELELRWQFWKRFSVVGFTGYGVAWNDFELLDDQINVWTGGGGIRYELARRYGLHFGADVAWSPDDFAIYVVFGSSWMRL
jgi:hypothetical protein